MERDAFDVDVYKTVEHSVRFSLIFCLPQRHKDR